MSCVKSNQMDGYAVRTERTERTGNVQLLIHCQYFQHTPVMYDNHRGYSIACHGPIPTIEGIPTSQILGCQELDFFAA